MNGDQILTAESVMQVHAAILRERPLLIWTIFHDTFDYPKLHAMRPFRPDALPMVMVDESIEPLRLVMRQLGLVPFVRAEEDDACVVESWL